MSKKWINRDIGAAGYTMVEMLVVIGILGLLASALLSSFSFVKSSARKAHANALVSEAATAFTLYLQKEREWPKEFLNKQEMDHEVCRIFQQGRYLDITPYEITSGGGVTDKRNMRGVDRFGLLDPWGQLALKKNKTQAEDTKLPNGSSFKDHRLQYRLDKNYDGYVDSSEGAPKGVKVRASVLVWSRGPDGQDDFNLPGRYPRDDSLSWPAGIYR